MDLTPDTVSSWLSIAQEIDVRAILMIAIIILLRVVYMLWTRYERLLDRVIVALESSSNSNREVIALIKEKP